MIKSLLEQGAPIDNFGVGTKLVTGAPDVALDGMYKLTMATGKPRLKLSESKEKITLPVIKQVLRVLDDHGKFYGADAVILAGEGQHLNQMRHPFEEGKLLEMAAYRQEPLLQKVMENGKRTAPEKLLTEIAEFAQ